MIETYANQILTLKRPSIPNEYNESSYSSIKIKGRKEAGFKLVRNQYGEEVVSSARVFTRTAANVEDLIDDMQVISSEPMTGIDGETGFYTVYLK